MASKTTPAYFILLSILEARIMNKNESLPSQEILDEYISRIRSSKQNPEELLQLFKSVSDFVLTNVEHYEKSPLYNKMRLCTEKTEKLVKLKRRSLIQERLPDIVEDATVCIAEFSRTGGARITPR